nr:hypothetical protein [Tanacetum cinerariifolium]
YDGRSTYYDSIASSTHRGYEDATIVPAITADNFELKHGLLTLVQNKQFFEHDKEDPHAHVRYFNKITSTLKFPNVPNTIHQLDTFYNALNSKDQDSLNSVAGGNFLDKMPREYLAIIESKSKVHYSHNKPVVAKVSTTTSTSGISPDVPELKDTVKALLLDKKGQNQSPAPVKSVEETCVTCGDAHSYRNCPAINGNVYRDNIQEFVSQAFAFNYNQGNTNYLYQAPIPQTQGVSKEDFSAYVKANDAVMRDMQTPGQNMQNQLTNLTDLITKFVNSNSASTSSSGTLPRNIIANPRSDLKAITTRSEATKDTLNPTNNGSTEDVRPQANDAILKNMQTNMTSLTNSNLELKIMFGQFMKMNTASSLGSGTLSGNIITNPKEELKGITTCSGTAYQGLTIPTTSSSLPPVVERETEDTSGQRSESSSFITSSSDTEITALKAEMAEINRNLIRVLQVNQQVKAVTPNCETCSGPHSFNDCPATVGYTQNVYATGAYQDLMQTCHVADVDCYMDKTRAF